MQARTLTILIVLVDLKNAFLLLLREKHKNPALLNIYAFIDICAALANQGVHSNRTVFESYLREFCTVPWVACSPYDLWSARCSLIHAYSPLGHHSSKAGGAKPLFYYSWPERREEVENVLRSREYRAFVLLEIDHLKHIAIDAFNSMHRRVKTDAAFEEQFLSNAEHFLFDLQAFKLEAELSMLQELAERRRDDA